MEKPVKVPTPPDGKLADGFDVPVSESTERWTDVRLEDGSLLRLKTVVLGAIRVTGMYDPEGNPMYFLKAQQLMNVAEAKDEYKRPTPGSEKAEKLPN